MKTMLATFLTGPNMPFVYSLIGLVCSLVLYIGYALLVQFLAKEDCAKQQKDTLVFPRVTEPGVTVTILEVKPNSCTVETESRILVLRMLNPSVRERLVKYIMVSGKHRLNISDGVILSVNT